jgi:hypothetical protein
VAQAVYHLDRGDREAAVAAVRESFGVASLEADGDERGLALRVKATVPDAERPRNELRTLFRLERDAGGRWAVAEATYERIPLGEQP